MICEMPITKGPQAGQSATGTNAGAERHRRLGEELCDACREGRNARARAWSNANVDKTAEIKRLYQVTHAEDVAEYNRRWREANREWALERERRYRAEHREERNEQARRWRAVNVKMVSQYNRRYRRLNRDRVLEGTRRRTARKASALTVSFTVEQLADKMAYWGGRCWIRTHCDGAPYEQVDHVIPIARGGPHVLANLRPACRSCNAAKGARRVA